MPVVRSNPGKRHIKGHGVVLHHDFLKTSVTCIFFKASSVIHLKKEYNRTVSETKTPPATAGRLPLP